MNAIKKFREAAGLTQLKTAQEIGVSTATLIRYESGTREPRATELLKMSELFGCTVDELLGGSPPKSRKVARRKSPRGSGRKRAEAQLAP